MISISHPNIGEEEIEAVTRVLRSGKLVQGAEVLAFELEFEQAFGYPAVAVSSGTAALTLLLQAHGIGPGDKVVIPSFSFFATAEAVMAVGASPQFADIEPGTFTLAPASVSRVVTSETRAIIAVHLYGQPADMQALQRIADDHAILLLEDACQAHGASFGIQNVGAIADGGAFSFYPSKNMTTMEGGMVVANNHDVLRKVRLLRNHGVGGRAYEHELIGGNFKMTEVAAAIGRVQLKKLDLAGTRRRLTARYYTDRITERMPRVVAPAYGQGCHHAFNQYTVRVNAKQRDLLKDALFEQGIEARIYYPKGIHAQPIFMNMADPEEMVETERASREVLSLPVHPGLTEADREQVMHALEALT